MRLESLPLLIAFISMFCYQTVQSQFVPEPWTPSEKEDVLPSTQWTKSDQNLVWYEDFDGGLPADWINENLNGFCAFTHTYSGPQGSLSLGMPPINSQSAGNGFMILDSDLCSSQDAQGLQTNAYLQSPPIDISGSGNLMLSFQHSFRYCCSPTQTQILAEISTNGETWTSFDVRNGLGPNNTSPNAVLQAIDITHLTVDADQVWVRFRKTGASHYWWMIDDIALVSFVENDLEIVDHSTVNGYTQIPAGQLAPLAFEATIRNAGGKTQNNIEFTATINNYLFQSTLTHTALAPAQSKKFTLPETFIAPGRGSYKVNLSVTQQQEDMVPENNHVSFAFDITDTTYSRTGDALWNEHYIQSQEGLAFAAGNLFDIKESIDLTSLSIVLDEGTEPGATVMARVYQVSNGVFSQIVSSESHIVGLDDISSQETLTRLVLPFNDPVVLEPGQFVAVLYAPAQDGAILLATTSNAGQPENVSFTLNDNQWVAMAETPFVDMHFGNNTSECDPQYHFAVTNSLCGNATGSIEVVPLNGVGPYVYKWTGYPENEGHILDSITAGKYEVVITDAYGCEATHVVVVGDEEISVKVTTTPAICNAGGTALIEPVNGTEPFTYNWSHDSALQGPLAVELEAGLYNVKISDDSGCETTAIIEIKNEDELPVQIFSQDAFCGSASGTIELFPQAGIAPYTFQWADFPDSNDDMQENLLPGTYSFSVIDSNQCKFNATVNIGLDSYDLEAIVDKTNASCNLNNGAVSVEIINGQGPYIYQWSEGQEVSAIDKLAPGLYELTVFDQYGCLAIKSVLIENFGQMPQVELQVENALECGQNTGAFAIDPIDSTLTYTYVFHDNNDNGDEEDEIEGKELAAGFSMDNLVAGRYNVTVINSDGCELLVGVNISDAGAPAVTAIIEQVTCFGLSNGAISLNVDGGLAPEFLWDDASNSTAASISGLNAGVYNVQVSDNDCKSLSSFVVKQPALLHARADVNHIVCANEEKGSISLDILGGTAPYSLIWSNGYGNKDLQDVSAGNYTINITDFMNCTFQRTYTIEGNDPLLLSATLQQPTEGMSDGRIVLTVSGGTGGYTFEWNHGPQTSVLTDLAEGTYTVTVTDDAGCIVEESFMIGSTNVAATLKDSNEIRLYPNPASTRINVNLEQWTSIHQKALKVEVVNILGERVQMLDYANGVEFFSLEIGHFNKGIYFIRLSTDDQTRQLRFIKN